MQPSEIASNSKSFSNANFPALLNASKASYIKSTSNSSFSKAYLK